MDQIDRDIINNLQGGFPLSERPYADVAAYLGIDESDLINRLANLLESNMLSRFGPMYNVDKMGGAFSLVAMRIPEHDFDRIAEIVNRYPQVAHNYQREHAMNMWFVLATEDKQEVDKINAEIEHVTGYPVFNMPKLEEYFVGLRFEV